MNIWLLHVGEELPLDGTSRRFRYGRLADALVERGASVLRWAPTFRHATKTQRAASDHRVSISPGYDVQLVHAPGYRRNVGLSRLRSYRRLENRIRPLMRREPTPDLLVAAVPTIGWCSAAIEYGREAGVPVLVDVRDLWPDVYLTAAPKVFRGLGRVALTPAVRAARRVCRDADGVVGVSRSYTDWGLRLAGRTGGPRDGVFPLGHDPIELTASRRRDEEARLLAKGVNPSKSLCIYAGLFEASYDLPTVVGAARRMHHAGRDDVQFVLCGDGGQMKAVRRAAEGLPNVVLLGWVGADTITALMGWSQVGLAAYAEGAMQSLPNKPFEYLAGGLAVASSLPGELQGLLETHRCGESYPPGDPAALATTLTRMLANPTELAAQRQRAESLFHQQFASPKIYGGFAEHVLTLAQQTPRTSRRPAA